MSYTKCVLFFVFTFFTYSVYVGETTLPLHRRINLHRRVKSACEYVIKNVKDVCVGASFSVQIIEIFYGLDTRITSVSS